MKTTLLTFFSLVIFTASYSQAIDSIQVDSTQIWIDEIEESMNYQTGVIDLPSGNATITVPEGFKYLDQEQSIYVLTDLWGNPADSSILGLLVPTDMGVLTENGWVFSISFDDIGYVKDDDADDFDYDDILEEQQKEFTEANPDRVKAGYEPIEFIGWASKPYYDKDRKILHWAKELKFGEDTVHTLNYNLRLLGRKGIFMLNAIATVNELPAVKSNIDKVVGSVTFKEGHKYSDYIPDVDEVAAWSIGGLVAGKVLAKAGLFVFLAKFWKIIALAVAGGGGAIWKFIKGKKEEQQFTRIDKDPNPNNKPT